MNIAIDGPAGAGKSTVARAVAKELGYIYVDTGAMYRAMALFMISKGIAPEDSSECREACQEAEITITYEDGSQHVILNGKDVTGELRAESAGKAASAFSALPFIRERLVELQQGLAKERSVVMDGRDIGTVVLPDAPLKIFLTAGVRERALRRFKEILEKSGPVEDEAALLATIEEDIRKRDHDDETREASPLRRADDAVLLDSSDMTADEVVGSIVSMARAISKD